MLHAFFDLDDERLYMDGGFRSAPFGFLGDRAYLRDDDHDQYFNGNGDAPNLPGCVFGGKSWSEVQPHEVARYIGLQIVKPKFLKVYKTRAGCLRAVAKASEEAQNDTPWL
ncbi:hypothetical protein CU669_16910 [Paramagnetospirillum kuznetsovii]|uniref:Uncharacterized protein n=1 Tax=Paramagnetospirillum kuznetsovii TaxID=2053833 RepID=A0A364NUK9_9PROT|nr:hypothetical protein [Paramagnetospirillum kuznetsovii]RAU20761.1 hypothetical protein CU669_16910 [Paramagnetospirillum kuznetsovii]